MTSAIYLPKKRRYLPIDSPPSPSDVQSSTPFSPDSRSSPMYASRNNNNSPDYYPDPVFLRDEMDLRVPHNYSPDEVRRAALDGPELRQEMYNEVRIKVESLPLDLTVTSSSDRDCSSTMSSNASIGDCSNSNSMEINSTSTDHPDPSDSDHLTSALLTADHNRPHSTKRESNEIKLMKKNIEKYIDTNREFQQFRAKILGHQPSFSNSNMKRYKNNPYEVYDENYLKKREKNNLSAQKCREKRNLHEKTNVCLSHYLIVENSRLNKSNQYLIDANNQLKAQLEMINNFIKFGPMGK
ncbi:hypothetical protein M8J76_001956 [Diaphorina citri]|nr:hypothetical protein M8J75_000296 [Diaphorina citri]KAI5718899.1 hypothetical protein M8J76_001956 [Diaphorina citri]